MITLLPFILVGLCSASASEEAINIPVAKIGNGAPAPGEYVLWLQLQTPLSKLTSSANFEVLKEKFHVSILKEYQIGRLNGAHIKGDQGILEALSDNPLIQTIAPNFRIYGAGTIQEYECIEEEDALGDRKWDLTRISSRDLPDYNGGKYYYSGMWIPIWYLIKGS